MVRLIGFGEGSRGVYEYNIGNATCMSITWVIVLLVLKVLAGGAEVQAVGEAPPDAVQRHPAPLKLCLPPGRQPVQAPPLHQADTPPAVLHSKPRPLVSTDKCTQRAVKIQQPFHCSTRYPDV